VRTMPCETTIKTDVEWCRTSMDCSSLDQAGMDRRCKVQVWTSTIKSSSSWAVDRWFKYCSSVDRVSRIVQAWIGSSLDVLSEGQVRIVFWRLFKCRLFKP
jgi:hypothetical protein